MADKDPGKRTVGSLAKASLSVRYSRLINEQPSSRAGPATATFHPSDSASTNTGVSKPTLRTVVQTSPPVSMKSLLGLYQENIRSLQSPAWLLEEQRKLAGKNGNDPAGERLVAAGNSLIDLCRFVEILLNKIGKGTSKSDSVKVAQKLGEKLALIWSDLYLAVQYLRADCKRSGAFVRHAGVEVLNLGVELEDGRSYEEVWAQKFVSRLEMLSAGIADAYELLPRTLTRAKERSKSIKNVLSPNASNLKRSEADKRIGIFSETSGANAELGREISLICTAVNELVLKLGKSYQDSSEMTGMFKLCAARLESILSLPYSLKRWELELHRTHYFFRQAATRLSATQEMADHNKASSLGNLPYCKMADYIDDRFEDTMHLVLKKADPGYARHNFISRKQSGPIPSASVLRSPVNAPVLKDVAVDGRPVESNLTFSAERRDIDLARRITGAPMMMASVISPLSTNAVSVRGADQGARSTAGKNDARTQQADVKPAPCSIRQKALLRENAPPPSRVMTRAATMSVHWQEFQKLSQQQGLDKKTS